ncbi:MULTISPECIES: uroporphyrinogen-III synthase [Nitrosomonas]|uniref:Uroporphyrinogen-III synthase n=1 Tax=Nitrosomonas communis TaxID=44574 RepID=A0A0F7KFM4_9PROT|nr:MULTISPECIES: uroporphyrinogen-III synthase [Nitrosomonas]AKH37953.1 uroporphyrinogen III synthase [Nitrosomonas communis]TYP85022.1 uroporphyrinogen-III synthase [Nitrosomonas communis]UVS63325.1 uroporphyrinogen-III synthase [Nitrosomonas sp. PLL12]
MPETQPLAGLYVLVTRPAHQASHLINEIKKKGGNPVLFPVLEISDTNNPQPLLKVISRLDEFDLAIFVSPNAVDKAVPLIQAHRTLPPNLKIAVVGEGSANKLRQYGIKNIIVPSSRYDSEALLGMPELQHVLDKNIVIFRGNDGRKLLGETLIQRGAHLEYIECYRRDKPKIEVSPLLDSWTNNALHAVTVTSSEGLHNLFDMIGKVGQQLLKKTPLFTAHERIACFAKELGLTNIHVTAAGDDGLVQGLLEYFLSIKN